MLLLSLFAPLVVAAPALAESPFDGTWKIDLGASKLPEKPDAFLLKDGVYECQSCVPSFKVKADGAFHPVTGHPYYDAVSIKVADPHTIVETDRKGAKTVLSATNTVTPDGQTLHFSFKDMTSANGSVVTGKGTQARVTKGPVGAHAISGSWRTTSLTNFSENGLALTFKEQGDMLSMSTPTGQSYTAKFGGPAVPIKGDTGGTHAAVKKTGARSFEETDTRGGKTVSVATITISPDGKTMTAMIDDREHGSNATYKLIKQ
jgi:hypothetical protein